jgi:hypothetical protein
VSENENENVEPATLDTWAHAIAAVVSAMSGSRGDTITVDGPVIRVTDVVTGQKVAITVTEEEVAA